MKTRINNIPTDLENDVQIIPNDDYGFEVIVITVPSRTTKGQTYRVEMTDHGAGWIDSPACHCKGYRHYKHCWHQDHALEVWKARQDLARTTQMKVWTVKKATGMSAAAFRAEWGKAVRTFGQDRLRAARHLASMWGVPAPRLSLRAA